MSTPLWPIGDDYPQSFQLGVTGEPYRPVIYSSMATGPASSRLEDDITFMVWTGDIVLTTNEMLTRFKDWLQDTIAFGDIAFTWKDPHTRAEKDFKLITVNSYTSLNQTMWKVSLTIQEVP